jgi:adenosylcobinamide-phosphate synthase
VGGPVLLGIGAQQVCRSPRSRTVLVAATTWAVLGARSLRREAETVAEFLHAGDLDGARGRLPHLVGRDPAGLDSGDVARAVVESVAENTSDAVVAPLFWGAVAGVPGLVGYRAVNTLDAMVGHRSARYERFGWTAARLDDVANLLPARITAAMVVLISGRPGRVARLTLRDAPKHPSPNAGWCEAAFAAALNLRLGGANFYEGRRDDRNVLGDGVRPTASDVRRAVTLSRRVAAGAACLAMLVRCAPAGGRISACTLRATTALRRS